MTLVEIYTLEDAKQENVSTLTEGEHVIGRGDTFKCNDKRVSRKHALINVGKDIVTIKAVHVNPCFFKAADGNSITILPKDTSVVLHDGDQFALLADVFWFRVKLILKNNREETVENGEAEFLKNVSVHNKAAFNNAENSITNTSYSKFEATAVNILADVNCVPSTSKRCLDEGSLAEQTCKRQKSSEKNEDVDPNMNTSEDAIMSPANLESLNTSQNTLNKNSVREQNLGTDIDSGRLISNLKAIVEEDYGKKDEQKEMSVSENTGMDRLEVDNNSPTIKQEKPDENVKVNRETLSDSEAEEEENKKDTSNKPNNIPIKVKTEEENKKDTNNEPNNIPVKVKTERNEDPDPQTSNNEEDKHEGSSNNQNCQNDASCSTDNQGKKSRRERCWYGPTCYRKNPIHRADFSHPGDDDYDSDPEDDRPVCPFGDSCYRRNIDHRRQFLHLQPPAPKPNGGDGQPAKKQRPKKKAKPQDSGDDQSSDDDNNSDDGTTRKKRKAAMKKTYYDSPLDDYDYNDPFIDDASSDAFELSSDDDDDDETTEWEDSQRVDEQSQDTRRLIKEAKRFTKAKGKKK